MTNKEYQIPINRRTILATLGTAGVSALAGCGSATDSSIGEPSEKVVPAPSVETGNRWKLITPKSKSRILQKGSIIFLDYQAVGHINRYEDNILRRRIREDTFGEVDRPFSIAFCGRIDVFPSSVSLASSIVGSTDESILENLKSAMREFGVTNIRDVGSRTFPDAPGEFKQVVGEYHIDPVIIEGVDLPHSNRDRLRFGEGTIPIKGIVTNWKSDGSILVGGGVYPDGPFRETEEITMSNSISLSINIDLHLQPQQREAEIVDFVRSISR